MPGINIRGKEVEKKPLWLMNLTPLHNNNIYRTIYTLIHFNIVTRTHYKRKNMTVG